MWLQRTLEVHNGQIVRISRLALIAYSSFAVVLTLGVDTSLAWRHLAGVGARTQSADLAKPGANIQEVDHGRAGRTAYDVQFIGDATVKTLGVIFPGPLCGMLLLLGFLFATGGPSQELKTVSSTLIDHLGLLFVPAGTAIVSYGGLFALEGFAILVALFVSTTVAVHIGGVVADRLARPACTKRDAAAA
jgi:holin-like protein